MTKLKVTVLSSIEALRSEMAQGSIPGALAESVDIFYTLEWFENLAAHGLADSPQAQAHPYLLLVNDPVNANWTCLPLLAGDDLTGLSNYYSSLLGPISWQSNTGQEANQSAHQATCAAMASYLRQAQARWPIIRLDPLDVESSFYQAMPKALANAGYWVDRYFCFGNWYLEVANRSFAAYYPSLPSALRHSIERGRRRLTKSGEWRVHIQQSNDARLDGAIADFVAVYDQSWKASEPNALFIPGLIRMAAAQGWLRLGVLTLDGRAIAAQLWLVKDQKASIFKLAYVKGFEKLSAGSVLTDALMRHAMDVDKVREVDYLTGDDAYKQDWMSHRRERWGIVAFRPGTWTGFGAGCRHFAGKALKGITR